MVGVFLREVQGEGGGRKKGRGTTGAQKVNRN
jgi:hypothetical protein